MKKITKIALFLAFVLCAMPLFADSEVSFTASAPDVVVIGTPFQLIYTVNEQSDNLRIPELADFDILAGPYSSTSSSVQWINGKRTSSYTQTYTYTLSAKKEGTFTINPATVRVKKEKYQSNTLSIKVLPPDKDAENESQQQHSGGQVSLSQQITKENLFVLPVVSRYKIREQEHTLVTYKLYSKVNVVDIQSVKFPDFKDFMVQEVELPQNKQFTPENYKGKNYYAVALRQYLLFPQKTGTLKIDPMSCEVIVRVPSQTQVRSFFDSFFETYQDVRKALTTSPVKIDVEPLPTPQPTDFCGGVGSLSMSSKINKTELETNESLTIQIKISGSGNLKMVKNPKLKLPSDFEVYEPKVTNDFNNTTAGVSGTKTIEYLAIPRHSGKYSIPATTISYFDTKTQKYKTLTTEAYELIVKKGTSTNQDGVVSNFTNQEKVQLIASDIRYIAVGDYEIHPFETYFFGTWQFWFWILCPLFITLVLIVFFRKKARENADIALVRNKKANKMARKRLKIAAKNLALGNKTVFYDEISKALWGYVGDKLAMPLAELNKENVVAKLAARKVPEGKISQFIDLLNDCEFARYAPADDDKAMDKFYEKTAKLITELEQTIKK